MPEIPSKLLEEVAEAARQAHRSAQETAGELRLIRQVLMEQRLPALEQRIGAIEQRVKETNETRLALIERRVGIRNGERIEEENHRIPREAWLMWGSMITALLAMATAIGTALIGG